MIILPQRYKVIPSNQMTGGMNLETVTFKYDIIPQSVLDKLNFPNDPIPSPIFPGMFYFLNADNNIF